MTKARAILIADDYGLGERHDAAIRSLLARDAIDATSVLVETCTKASAEALLDCIGTKKIGLHFNLTYPAGGITYTQSRNLVLLKGLLGLGARRAQAALDRQLELFRSLFGRQPDYIDGHEHCHAYPTVSRIVLVKAAHLGIPVRSIRPIARPIGLKERVLARLGNRSHALAQELGVETNWGFGGILPLDDPERAIAVLETQIEAANRAAQSSAKEVWVMVHPGDEHDPVQIEGHSAKLRSLETEYLLSRM